MTDVERWDDAIQFFFDRVELGFCSAWLAGEAAEGLETLQAENRAMTNEKNKYLTIFESLSMPAFFVSSAGRIENLNAAAAAAGVFNYGDVPGSTYYSRAAVGERPAVLGREIAEFIVGGDTEQRLERALPTSAGPRDFAVSLKAMLDVSGKFAGVTVTLSDITERKQAEEAMRDMSLTDELTGLDNRHGLHAHGGHLLRMASRLRLPVSMLFVDMDNMKRINDEFGHAAGDEALRDLGGAPARDAA
jgi:PAS domain S-box-containing protein